MTEPERKEVKEVKLAAKMRERAIRDGLPKDHPLFSRAAALDVCAQRAFVPGGAPPGAHQAFRHARDDANAVFRDYKARSR